ncbi:MAG: branched-chain amino acid ABC transporter permease [Kiloniellales bacterium]|nr:branched-chain amino acid ABC transporter permease [Kiloniellales bacterium]
MSSLLVLEQILNGLQFGITLFLMAAGLTLIFGIVGVLNLAHGSLYMFGAYVAASSFVYTGSFLLALVSAIVACGLVGLLLEVVLFRHIYQRSHLDQVLATFGLILTFNEGTKVIWGPRPLYLNVPDGLDFTIDLLPGLAYPAYRLAIILTGLFVAGAIYLLISHTRLGMLIRAGASNREMLSALGSNVERLFLFVFALSAILAGFAGAMVGPIQSVEVGIGEEILILAFVVVVIGGIGSVRGAFVGALLVGLVDTLGRAFLPGLFRLSFPASSADAIGTTIATIAIYLLMAAVLLWRPHGLFTAR